MIKPKGFLVLFCVFVLTRKNLGEKLRSIFAKTDRYSQMAEFRSEKASDENFLWFFD